MSTRFTLTLDGDLDRAVDRFMNDEALESKAAAVRTILWRHLAATPFDAESRLQVSLATKRLERWSIKRLHQFFIDLTQQLQTQIHYEDAVMGTKGDGQP